MIAKKPDAKPYAAGSVVEGVYKSYGRFGFVLTDPDHEDVYVSDRDRLTAMNNDTVAVKTSISAMGRHKSEGTIVKVLERANETVVGTYDLLRQGGQVTPIDEKMGVLIDIPEGKALDAKSGARVVVKITTWPEIHRNARGEVTEVIGYEGDKGVDIDVIVAQHKLPHVFSDELMKEADHLPREIVPEEGVADYRDLKLVTIDGPDSKDLDDAVYCVRKDNGHFQLGVHIADVSRYVRHGMLLDDEAYRRGTSCYLADRVIPMLPFQLSNDLCSLNAGEDRYAMSCIMDVAPDGTVTTEKVTPSMIHVGRRCNYPEINKAFHEGIMPEDLKEYMPMLTALRDCADALRADRSRRGAIDFDFPEYKVILDEMGTPLRIEKRVRDMAEKMVEDAMIAANEAVARFLRDTGHTAVYRVHGQPDGDKLDALKRLTEIMGTPVKLPKEPKPGDIQKLLSSAKGSEAYAVIEVMTLRSLPQACYSTENIGHFGIASTCYTHFTSPIRRYPDLMVHRLIRQALFDKPDKAFLEKQADFLTRAAEHCSVTEQTSVDAERDTTDLKMAEYMVPFVGEPFDATVTGVTRFGIFVGLDNGVEGLVHIDTMDDDIYEYNEDTLSLKGKFGGKYFSLGMPVRVTLVKANKEKSELDFMLGEIGSPEELERRVAEAAEKRLRRKGGNRNGGNGNRGGKGGKFKGSLFGGRLERKSFSGGGKNRRKKGKGGKK